MEISFLLLGIVTIAQMVLVRGIPDGAGRRPDREAVEPPVAAPLAPA